MAVDTNIHQNDTTQQPTNSAVHYPGHSPNVLFLHSICGVATNLFPMDPSKLPVLAAILSPEELTQIQAFPSMLRLLYDLHLLKVVVDGKKKRSNEKERGGKRLFFLLLGNNSVLTLGAFQAYSPSVFLSFGVVLKSVSPTPVCLYALTTRHRQQ
jgi:hypothetical protein